MKVSIRGTNMAGRTSKYVTAKDDRHRLHPVEFLESKRKSIRGGKGWHEVGKNEYLLEYDSDGYPELPACLYRRSRA